MDSSVEYHLLSYNKTPYVVIIATTSLLGIFSNGLAMFLLYNGGRLYQSFQQMCFSHCISNSLVLIFYLCYCCSVMISDSDWSTTSPVARIIGGVMVGLWDVGVYSHLMTSVNRLLAIFFPLEYHRFQTKQATRLIIAGIWLMGILHFLPYLYVSECYIVFSSRSFLWTFAPTECGWVLGNPLDFYPGIAVSFLIASCDMMSLYRIKSLHVTSSNINRMDVVYFFQTIVQFVLFVVKKSTFYLVSRLFVAAPVKNNMELFFTTTFTWELFHFLDGAALIPFHIRDYLNKRRERQLQNTTTASQYLTKRESGTALSNRKISSVTGDGSSHRMNNSSG